MMTCRNSPRSSKNQLSYDVLQSHPLSPTTSYETMNSISLPSNLVTEEFTTYESVLTTPTTATPTNMTATPTNMTATPTKKPDLTHGVNIAVCDVEGSTKGSTEDDSIV